MASGVGGSRTLVIDIDEDSVVTPTVIDDSIPVANGMKVEESGTQPEGPSADVAEPVS